MIAHRFLPATTRSISRRALLATSFSTTPSNLDVFSKISFIGTGKMAQAMIAPLITQKLQIPSSITAFDVSDEALKRVEELYPGVQVSNSIQDSVKDANLIVYAVKPQNVGKVHAEIRRAKEERGADGVRDDAIILSVAAGTPIASFVHGSLVDKVARSMPNTPAQSK
jgi:pyrroline-5-carboxylate reductase